MTTKCVKARKNGHREYGCPVCAGRIVTESNSLRGRFPELADEWHPTRNGTNTPANTSYGSKRIVWWQGKCGHEFESAVNSRTGNGNGCRFCSGNEVCLENCLATKRPDLAKEWHPNLNGDLSPFDVTSATSRKVWWLCGRNHSWEASVSNRNKKNGTGCPVCISHAKSSKPQLLIFSELYHMFPNAKNNGKINKTEFDILIKDIGIAIEYDGHYWHKSKKLLDSKKNAAAKMAEITLIRIRDKKAGKLSEHDILIDTTQDIGFDTIRSVITKILALVTFDQDTIERIVAYAASGIFQNTALYERLERTRIFPLVESNIAVTNPEIISEWDVAANGFLQPEMFTRGSNQRIVWQCQAKIEHIWIAPIYMRCRRRASKCPFCSGHRADSESNLAARDPLIAKDWDAEKNSHLVLEEIGPGSRKIACWRCPAGHSEVRKVSERVRARGCAECKRLSKSQTSPDPRSDL